MKLLLSILILLTSNSIFAQIEITDNEYEKGYTKDGFKEGVWEYYDTPGELALRIDYDSAKLLYLKPDTNEYVIKVNNSWIRSKVDKQPRYLGSMIDFKKISSIIKYPNEAKANKTVGRLYISFEVDTTGKAGNFEIINDIGDKCFEAVMIGLNELPNYWLTAQKGGKVYPSRFIIPVLFKMVLNDQEISSRKNKKVKNLPLAKEIEEMVIIIEGKRR